MSALTIDENSPVFVTVSFTDENGAPTVPTTVDWRLDDLSNKVQVKDWTVLTPANPLTFSIRASDNGIIDTNRDSELKEAVIRIDDGFATEAHKSVKYTVTNLFGVV